MKSKIMKQIMNINENLKYFKYPLNDDSMLDEIENNFYLEFLIKHLLLYI